MLAPLKQNKRVSLGTDPEFFFRKDGVVIGSEKVLEGNTDPQIAIDGVQVEIHPQASFCRESLAVYITNIMLRVRQMLPQGFSVDGSQIVEIGQKELDEMKEENKKFGCSISYNTYKRGRDKATQIKANPLKYLKRSAGGHIHMGGGEIVNPAHYVSGVLVPAEILGPNDVKKMLHSPEIVVPILDILVGNTMVLLDRDEGNAERRKNYGKAGEYRLPEYGLEYRTLSNFWLRGVPLMSLVTGMCRMAVEVCMQTTPENDYVGKLMSLVDIKDIIKAINTNDFDLAMENYKKYKPFILEVSGIGGHYPLTKGTIDQFEYLVKIGIDKVFPTDIVESWTNPNRYSAGFNSFANYTLKPMMDRENTK